MALDLYTDMRWKTRSLVISLCLIFSREVVPPLGPENFPYQLHRLFFRFPAKLKIFLIELSVQAIDGD